MRILHVVPGLNDPANGIAVAAKWIAESQRRSGDDVSLVDTRAFTAASLFVSVASGLVPQDAVWVHSMWLPSTLRACWCVLRTHASIGVPRLVRMPHGCLDPVKVRYHYCKKILVTPFERSLMARADRVIATEEDERRWISTWCPKAKIEMLDLGSTVGYAPRSGLGNRKFLFVGRMHPLKGFDVLIAAIRKLRDSGELPADFALTALGKDEKGLRAEYERMSEGLPVRFLGEVAEAVKRAEMASADCLVLPTLSENFALVVKESLEQGVPVITTDGAKIWKGHAGVSYVDGFVSATFKTRVERLCDALNARMRT